jgi:hypothetical protein
MHFAPICIIPATESDIFRVSFLVILVVSILIFLKIFTKKDSTFYRVISVLQLAFAILGFLQVNFEIPGRKDRITGKWKIENVYRITKKDPQALRQDLSVVRGVGEQYMLYNPDTHSFQGLGWVNMGTSEKELDAALKDTAGNDFVTFRIKGGVVSPEKEDKFVFLTRSVHKTLSRHINTSEPAQCEVRFPMEISESNWVGEANCYTDSFDVQIKLKLSKLQ